MYPANYFVLFPPFPRENKVFIAMSFDQRFEDRWTRVIGPAIRNIRVNDVPLEPHRVDIRQVSDSILTEILAGITITAPFLRTLPLLAPWMADHFATGTSCMNWA